jgi:hypothetical protein
LGIVVFVDLQQIDLMVRNRMVAIGISVPSHLARATSAHIRNHRCGRVVFATAGRAMQVDDCVPRLTVYGAAR